MRRFDKKKNINKANILAEQRYLESSSLIKEGSLNIGDTVMKGNNFYKVISEPFTATDYGHDQYAADNNGAQMPNDLDYRMFYTAIRAKNIDTGQDAVSDISNFKKVNPEDVAGLKQAKLDTDAANKIKTDKERAEREIIWRKESAIRKAKEEERISSKGDIGLVNNMISNWDKLVVDTEDNHLTHDEVGVSYLLMLNDDSDEYYVNFDIGYEVRGRYDDYEFEFTLDLVNVYKGDDLVYKGRAEFLGLFDREIVSWIEDEGDLTDRMLEALSDYNSDY